MTETLHQHSPETPGFDTIEATPKAPAEAQNDTPKQLAEKVEALTRQAKQEAPKERLALPVDNKAADNRPIYIDRTVKKLQFKQTLKQARRELPAAERLLSRVVHQPAVRVVSDISAKTITRPSGLFGGGILAFAGSLTYLYLTKHIGLSYNYLLFAVFFIGGFIAGLLLELLAYLIRPRQKAE